MRQSGGEHLLDRADISDLPGVVEGNCRFGRSEAEAMNGRYSGCDCEACRQPVDSRAFAPVCSEEIVVVVDVLRGLLAPFRE